MGQKRPPGPQWPQVGPEGPGQGQGSSCRVWLGSEGLSRWPPGKSYTMIGKDSSPQSLGIVPCAISWLFRLIDERKERVGARFSVRVSAVEVCGRDQSLRDLLAEVASSSLQDAQSPGVHLREDPVCGAQVCRGRRAGSRAAGSGAARGGGSAPSRSGAVPAVRLSAAPEPERAAGAHG